MTSSGVAKVILFGGPKLWHTLRFYSFLMIKFIQCAFPYQSRWSKGQFMKFMVWNEGARPPQHELGGMTACPPSRCLCGWHHSLTWHTVHLEQKNSELKVKTKEQKKKNAGLGPFSPYDCRIRLFILKLRSCKTRELIMSRIPPYDHKEFHSRIVLKVRWKFQSSHSFFILVF